MTAQDKILLAVLGVICGGITAGFLIGRVPFIIPWSMCIALGLCALPIAKLAS